MSPNPLPYLHPFGAKWLLLLPSHKYVLLKNGVSIAAQDKTRCTALDEAVYNQHWDVVELLLKEYFRVVVPAVRGKYKTGTHLSPETKLVYFLVQSQGTLSTAAAETNSTRPRTRSTTEQGLDVQRTIVAALKVKFVNVFFLLAVADPEVLSEVLSGSPCLHEQSRRLLPSRLNREADKELLAHLAQAGYTLPEPAPHLPSPEPPVRWRPRQPSTFLSVPSRPDPPPLTIEQRSFLWACEAGYAQRVHKSLQTHGDKIVNAAGPRHRTPLHVAAQQGHLEVVKLLVEHGADLAATTFLGTTAEVLAERFKKRDVAAYLKAKTEEAAGTPRRGE